MSQQSKTRACFFNQQFEVKILIDLEFFTENSKTMCQTEGLWITRGKLTERVYKELTSQFTFAKNKYKF